LTNNGKTQSNLQYYADRKKMIEDILRTKEGYQESEKNSEELAKKKKASYNSALDSTKMKKDVEIVKNHEIELEEETKINSGLRILTIWAGSTKNIIGSSAAAAIAVTGTMIGAGGWIPIFAAGAYAVGMIFSPEDDNSKKAIKEIEQVEKKAEAKAKKDKKKSVVNPQDEITQAVYKLKNDTFAQSSKFSNDAKKMIENITGLIGEICQNYVALENNVDSRIMLDNIVHQYLPETISEFIALPSSYAITARMTGKKTPKDVFEQNLKLIEGATLELRDKVYSGNIKNLEIQGQFLAEKLRKELNELSIEKSEE
jgi:hypothetical protein